MTSGIPLRSSRESVVLCSSMLLAMTISACAKDALNANPPAPPTCAGNERLVDGACVLMMGGLEGRLCNETNGTWLANATVSIAAEGQTYTATTDAEGRFEMDAVPVGVWTLQIDGATYDGAITGVRVVEGQTRFVGAESCDSGRVVGHLCDPDAGRWVAGAQVSINDVANSTTTTDANGEYTFENLPPGDYLITVNVSGTQNSFSVTVAAGQTTTVGPASCYSISGSIDGRICSNEGVWLAQATVYIDLDGDGSGDVTTTTDANGFFTLSGVPDGTHTVHVVRGSFDTSFQATVTNGGMTQLPAPVCIPPTTRIAVVTGIYDSVQDVLTDLGFVVKQTYNASRTPTVQNASGSIDIIDGVESNFWFDEFLNDAAWMAEYDIIFLNCGLAGLNGSPYEPSVVASPRFNQVFGNVRAFVNGGGSLYASDWASEMVRIGFPDRVNFFGNDTNFGEARVGRQNGNQAAYVVDQGLATALNRTDLTLNLNLDIWVLMDQRSAQPSDLRVLVQANVRYYPDPNNNPFSTTALNNAPLVVRFNHGTGRVLFTSAHNESQTTQDLRDVLNYIVFEL